MLPLDVLLKAGLAALLVAVGARLALAAAQRPAPLAPGLAAAVVGVLLLGLGAGLDAWGAYIYPGDPPSLAALGAALAGALLLLAGVARWLPSLNAVADERDALRDQNAMLGKAAHDASLRVWKAEEEHQRLADERDSLDEAVLGFEQRWRALVQQSPSIILTLDAAGKVTFSNRASLSNKGEALLGQSFLAWLPAARREAAQALLQKVFGRSQQGGLEVCQEAPDGTKTWYAMRFGPVVRDGTVIAATVIATDITEWKKAEEAQLLARERDREIGRLAELATFRTQLLNTAAHELSNPLSPIKTHLFLIAKAGLDGLDEKQQASFKVVEKNIQRLTMLVSDMRDLTRVQAGKLNLQFGRVDYAELVADAVASFEEPARKHGITLDPRAAPGLVGEADAQRLMQVLFNFVSNALKFTPAGGCITLEAAPNGDQAVVRVRDTGKGLTREQMAKLFQPFAQVHQPGETSEPGTGLGLYISRGIVEAHGGRIWVESDGPGRGASFCFAVPLQRRVAAAPAQPVLPQA